jgi:MurNAc alpha-1-phosphate uridylyltransferase
MFPVAILAGGLATRLRPITNAIPKALVEVAGVPFIVRQLDDLQRQGCHDVILCVSHLGAQIEALIGDGSQLGMRVRYVFDGPVRLGTGGALRQALPLLGEAFFVLYGDSFLPIEFAAVERAFLAARRPALMTVLRNHDRWDTSNVEYRNGVVVEYNKRHPRPEMTYIDYGLSILSAGTLDAHAPATPFDLADVFHDLSRTGRLAALEVHQRFYEIGSHEGLAATEDYFKNRGRPR